MKQMKETLLCLFCCRSHEPYQRYKIIIFFFFVAYRTCCLYTALVVFALICKRFACPLQSAKLMCFRSCVTCCSPSGRQKLCQSRGPDFVAVYRTRDFALPQLRNPDSDVQSMQPHVRHQRNNMLFYYTYFPSPPPNFLPPPLLHT